MPPRNTLKCKNSVPGNKASTLVVKKDLNSEILFLPATQ